MSGQADEEFAKDHLVKTALSLFASLGYDGTDNEMIANAAGVDRQEVAAAGGRTALYLGILETFYQAQSKMLDEAAAAFTPDEAGIRDLFDRMLDFYVDHLPQMALWQHRYLHDAADIADIDTRYRMPMLRKIADVFGTEALTPAGVQMLLNFVSWSLRGFLSEGVIRLEGPPLGPDTVEGQNLLRSYLHELASLVFSEDRLRDR
ncbi:hypothetical protein [Actinocorallia aurantiaca]